VKLVIDEVTCATDLYFYSFGSRSLYALYVKVYNSISDNDNENNNN